MAHLLYLTALSVSPLRQRIIEDMAMRKLKPITQKDYLSSVKRITRFLGHSPHKAIIYRSKYCWWTSIKLTP